VRPNPRARGFAVYAAIRSLGRAGIVELIESSCAHARRFADGIRELGAEALNDVVLNQVLFRFETDEETEAALAAVQAGGEAWMGGTTWAGRRAIRLSVSSWQTTEADIDRTLEAYAGQLAARHRNVVRPSVSEAGRLLHRSLGPAGSHWPLRAC
jgi:glutamate/tyrosine decarboxylase-like PLP-dependent enzyme